MEIGAAAWPLAARAQQPTIPVIGFLHSKSPDAVSGEVSAFKRGLNEAGYIEGQNVAIEYRWADGQFDRVPGLLADLVRRPLAVLVAGGGTVQAVKAAGTSIPTIFTTGGDPVRQGLVPTLNRPGGNMTGVAWFAMLCTTIFRPSVRTAVSSSSSWLLAAFDAFAEQHVDALIVGGDPFFYRWREQMVAQAARHALPTCYGWREFVTAGGLMSYGADLTEAYHQVGVYAARILKGARPADLPVVQAEKVELVLNLKTAKTLGLTFPLTLLGRADKVIE